MSWKTQIWKSTKLTARILKSQNPLEHYKDTVKDTALQRSKRRYLESTSKRGFQKTVIGLSKTLPARNGGLKEKEAINAESLIQQKLSLKSRGHDAVGE